jgi:hypothetical protein
LVYKLFLEMKILAYANLVLNEQLNILDCDKLDKLFKVGHGNLGRLDDNREVAAEASGYRRLLVLRRLVI